MAIKTIMECDICGKEKEGKYLIADITRKEHTTAVIIPVTEEFCTASSAYSRSNPPKKEYVYICEECEAKIKAFCKSIKDGKPKPTKVYNCFTCKKGVDIKKGVDMEYHAECKDCETAEGGIPSLWEPAE